MQKLAQPKETITLRVPGNKKRLKVWKSAAIQSDVTLGEFVVKAVEDFIAKDEQKNFQSPDKISSHQN